MAATLPNEHTNGESVRQRYLIQGKSFRVIAAKKNTARNNSIRILELALSPLTTDCANVRPKALQDTNRMQLQQSISTTG